MDLFNVLGRESVMGSRQIRQIIRELERVFETFRINIVPRFEVLNSKYVPKGLKPHTRSICWLAEQVILQNVEMNSQFLKISDCTDPDSDIAAWDTRLKLSDLHSQPTVFVNIKVSDVTRPIRKNDIASVKKLLQFYRDNPDALLFYVVMMIRFDNTQIYFERPPIVRYYPWLNGFVVNPRNEHVQCFYEVDTAQRTIPEFLELLRQTAEAKGVGTNV